MEFKAGAAAEIRDLDANDTPQECTAATDANEERPPRPNTADNDNNAAGTTSELASTKTSPPPPLPPAAMEKSLPLRYVARVLRQYRRVVELRRELALYIPFLLLFVFFQLFGLDAASRYWLNSQAAGNLEQNQFAIKESIWTLRPGELQGYHVARDYTTVRSADDWHAWAQSVLLPELWDAGQSPEKNLSATVPSSRWIVGGTRPLGAVRFRFLRVQGESCSLNWAALRSDAASDVHFLNPTPGIGIGGCYGSYADSSVNKTDLVLEPPSVAGREGVTTLPFRDCPVGQCRVLGLFNAYPCGGNVFDVPFSLSLNDALTEVQRLRNSFQSSPDFGALEESLVATRLITVQFFTYTLEANIFSRYRAVSEVTVAGRIASYVEARNFFVWTPALAGSTAYFAVFFALVLLYGFTIVSHAYHAARIGQLVQSTVGSGWFFVDLVNFSIFVASYILQSVWMAECTRSDVKVWYLDVAKQDAYPEVLETIEYLQTAQSYLTAVNVVLSFIRLIKFTALSRSMGVAMRTLQKAKGVLLSVLLLFVLVLLAYAVGGVILFKSADPDRWGTVAAALTTLLRLLLGDFDLSRMEQHSRFLTGLYFWTFATLEFFVTLSLFTGTLASMLTESAAAANEQREQEQALRDRHGGDGGVPQMTSRWWTAMKRLLKEFNGSESVATWGAQAWRRATSEWNRPAQLQRLQRSIDQELEAVRSGASKVGGTSNLKDSTRSSSHGASKVQFRDVVTLYEVSLAVEKLQKVRNATNSAAATNTATAEADDQESQSIVGLVADFWEFAVQKAPFDRETREAVEIDDEREALKKQVESAVLQMLGIRSCTPGSLTDNVWRALEEMGSSDRRHRLLCGAAAVAAATATGGPGSPSEGLSAPNASPMALQPPHSEVSSSPSVTAARGALMLRDLFIDVNASQQQLAEIGMLVEKLEKTVSDASAMLVEQTRSKAQSAATAAGVPRDLT